MMRAGIANGLRTTWRGLVAGAATLLVIVSWSAVRANRQLAAANALFIQARAYPYPLTGLRLQTPDAKVVESWQPNPSPTIDKYLVLVSSDSCRFCDLNSTHWEALVRGLTPTDRVAVWMIRYGSPAKDDPFSKLLEGRIPYKVLRVTDPVLFSLKTGLVATPTTMLLDAKMRPELVQAGVMTPEAMKAFEKEARGELTSITDPFLPPGALEEVPLPVSHTGEGQPGASKARALGRGQHAPGQNARRAPELL